MKEETTSDSTDLSNNVPASTSIPSGDNNDNNNKHSGGFYLRWSRIRKTVDVQDNGGGGLMRSSIAGRRASSAPLSRTFSSAALSTATTTKETKDILCEASGYAAPGEVLVCMGPSGSGKTSLLNCLSGRTSYQEGTISINGERLTGHKMKKVLSKTAYVKQADIFFEHLTVQDQLTYTALLRLPSTMKRDQKHDEVARIISLLRLGKVAENPISMCSGGEKKRVNIGTELLTDPMVLLLDEPTSGLDSTSAVSLIRLLSSLARDQGKTVLTTIHQPSSQLFRSFDRLLMISEGHVVYFGTPVASLDYLRNQNLACPEGYNAADHWMDLLVMDHETMKEREGDDENQNNNNNEQGQEQGDDNGSTHSSHGHGRRQIPRLQLQLAWDNEAVAEEMDAALIDGGDDKSVNTDASDANNNNNNKKGHAYDDVKKYNTSWATQFSVLIHRSLKGSRSSIFTTLNMIKSVAIGLVVGLIWWRMPYTERTVSDRSSYFFFTMAFWVFDSMFGALMAFPTEKVVILKERASASYHLSAYFLAKTCSDAPVRLVLPFLYMCCSFWMAGVDERFGVFLASTGCTLLSVLAGESLGLLVGASISEMDKAMTVLTVSSLGLMLLGGFFVENIPSFVKWAKYFSPFKYAFDGSLQLVFDRDVPCDGSGKLENLCNGSDTGYAKASDVISQTLGVQGSIAFNVGMLFVIVLVPRYVAYLALRAQKGGDRS
ncbi:Putative white-brown complex homolog protein 30 [Seminavis robusta]|uniref:White-brown complex homolog protein 30 n=1 Tax=Seminavis robusta TaxID=568900 RepID=A0A9N8ELJ7_9STRA|nr:Putative white-brown complex homolog protein 30 [Seminavis robusta]|eukprot:Sro1485_g276510.1 Putative white-brown complex homolog protein 30 (717) ;mRNA; r:4477-6797